MIKCRTIGTLKKNGTHYVYPETTLVVYSVHLITQQFTAKCPVITQNMVICVYLVCNLT